MLLLFYLVIIFPHTSVKEHGEEETGTQHNIVITFIVTQKEGTKHNLVYRGHRFGGRERGGFVFVLNSMGAGLAQSVE
jgi:hypothetical protein